MLASVRLTEKIEFLMLASVRLTEKKIYQRGRSRFEKLGKIFPNNPVFLGEKCPNIFTCFHFSKKKNQLTFSRGKISFRYIG